MRKLGLGLLVALGLSHVAGSLLTPLWPGPGKLLAGLGQASLAAPHPRVFCQVGPYEPFRYAFTLELEEDDGSWTRVALDAERYSRIAGPYMYRNVYGAVLAFGPFIEPATRDAILCFGLEDGDLLAPLDREAPPRRVRIHIEARGGGEAPPVLEVARDG